MIAWATNDGSSSIDLPSLSQYGALGIFVAVLLVGFRLLLQTILATNEKDRLRADSAEQALREQTKFFQESVIPAMIHMTDASKDMTDASKAMVEIVTQMRFEKRTQL